MKNTRKELLARIARFLMLHGSYVDDLGLLNGKMGIVLFFYHYARYTGSMVYDDFAGELLDEIYAEIHDHNPCNFSEGLCGIAWGVEYIIQHRFVEADANTVLADVDRMIQEWDVRKITDPSLETGLAGVGHYVISRYSGKKENTPQIPMDYIADLLHAIHTANQPACRNMTACLEDILDKEHIPPLSIDLLIRLLPPVRHYRDVVFTQTQPLGIQSKGLAGVGLYLLLVENTK